MGCGANESLPGALEREIKKFGVVSPKQVNGFASVSLSSTPFYTDFMVSSLLDELKYPGSTL